MIWVPRLETQLVKHDLAEKLPGLQVKVLSCNLIQLCFQASCCGLQDTQRYNLSGIRHACLDMLQLSFNCNNVDRPAAGGSWQKAY